MRNIQGITLVHETREELLPGFPLYCYDYTAVWYKCGMRFIPV